MMTPGSVALPEVDQPVAWSLQAMLNPSFPFLLIHRTFGNFSYVLLLTGGVLALRYMSQKRKNPSGENTAYFRWASSTCFTIGFFCFFPMPIIGWFYARVIQNEAPVAFMAMMGGHVSWHLAFKMTMIAIFLVIGALFVTKRYAPKITVWALGMGLIVVLAVIWIHPPLMWIANSAVAWRIVSTAIVLALLAWVVFRRNKGNADRSAWQWAMFVAGLAAFFAFAMGGFIRERSKSPDTVYGEIVKPEQTGFEADRYLVYTKWLKPRNELPEDLNRNRPDDWRRTVEQARRDGLELTDAEAERIIGYLEEHH